MSVFSIFLAVGYYHQNKITKKCNALFKNETLKVDNGANLTIKIYKNDKNVGIGVISDISHLSKPVFNCSFTLSFTEL